MTTTRDEAVPTEAAGHYRNARNYLRHARGEAGLWHYTHPSRRGRRTELLWYAFAYLLAAQEERSLARAARSTAKEET